ncbi:ABC-2 transporter permease [Clostridium formicaceticum]|uniref:ABC-2 transporter permease n=1 Tax=Clostridium formicaceticum TaxID=1497 RepID=A0AAC9WH49_9CLOT|nr:ABC-2 transporter permease [Clostridium formicaceticum]AOY77925.1 hypothetical protein BJL90_19910 [Clostridium formicaceticum]ARE88546.1 hypothetical protein CLFO_29520 [Clostridium formicaceticum]
MFSLIFKETIIQKKSFLFAILYGMFIFFVFGRGGGGLAPTTYIMGIVATTYIFIQTGCANDDKNKTEIIFNSLPISRREIVTAKYISSILFSIINLFMMMLLGSILSKLFLGKIHMITYGDIIMGLFSTWLLIAFYLPFYFKFGYIKTKYFNMFIFFLFFFAPSSLIPLIIGNPHHPIAKMMISLAPDHSAILLGSLFLAIAAIITFVSINISFIIYRKREL